MDEVRGPQYIGVIGRCTPFVVRQADGMVWHHAKSGDEYLCTRIIAAESTIFIIVLILSWNKQKRLLNTLWFIKKLYWRFFFGISGFDHIKKAPEVLF
ncbi:MAG: hypothetical protein ACOX4L_05645 [Bacillota bacterium]|jgi:hypothetical protein